MRRITFTSSFILFVLLLVLGVSPSFAADAPAEKVRVGVILPLSGDGASLGAALKNGVQLGMEKLAPEVREKIELHFEDDGLQPKNTLSAFYRLLNDRRIEIVLNASSATGKALSPIAEQKKVPFISIASDTAISKDRAYVFNFWVTPAVEAALAVPEAVRRGYKKIARITSLHDGAVSIRDAFDAENKGRITVGLDQEYPLDVKDFRPFLTKLRAEKDIDAVMVTLLPGQCGLFAKQARESGITVPLMGFELFEDRQEVENSGGALIGQWYVSADDPDDSFLKTYRERFPGATEMLASNGHDAVLLIGKAVETGVPPTKFHEFLDGLKDFSGAMGRYGAAGDNTFTLPAAVKVVTKDGFQKLGS